jgi:hypothetical protein
LKPELESNLNFREKEESKLNWNWSLKISGTGSMGSSKSRELPTLLHTSAPSIGNRKTLYVERQVWETIHKKYKAKKKKNTGRTRT